jgi:hypothetical protein
MSAAPPYRPTVIKDFVAISARKDNSREVVIRHNPTFRQRPPLYDALLINMPKMDGLELRERLLTERPGIRVLLMSGQIELLSENIPFLAKPFGPSLLKERMRELLVSAPSVFRLRASGKCGLNRGRSKLAVLIRGFDDEQRHTRSRS